MCGVAGFLDLRGGPASQQVVRRMTDAVAHRGPDGSGHWVSGPVALGHRRLSIIDLSDAGRQPMETEDGRYILSYNGEIYNFAELRSSLQAHGDVFHSTSDSEVLLKALARWGLDALTRLNGLFAFAFWDVEERTLTLARDRYGIKPMYYAVADGALVFGSEIKALLEHPALGAKLNLAALRQYLTFQNIYDDQTLFDGVRLLPPGSCLRARIGAPSVEVRRYWSFDFETGGESRPAADVAADVRDLFRQAVSRQLVADVEVGAFLSGGMDSGSVTAVAASQLPYLRTFTCGFDLSSASGLELYFDERRDAELMSATFQTEHYEMVLKSGDMERAMPALVRHLEEPRVGQCYPNFLVSRLASKFNKVVLAGSGGDELFAGYPWRYWSAFSLDPAKLADNTFAFWQRVFPSQDAIDVFAPVWSSVKDAEPRAAFDSVFETPARAGDREAAMAAIQSFEAKTFLAGILSVEDKVSMAHSLEVRVPFLDNDLVDFARRLPARYKLSNLDLYGGDGAAATTERPTEGKAILRQALAPLVPPQIANREKQGFSAPDASWFKGSSIDYVRRRIGGPRARIYQVLDFGFVKPHLDRHFSGAENKRLLIWSLLYLEELFEQHSLV